MEGRRSTIGEHLSDHPARPVSLQLADSRRLQRPFDCRYRLPGNLRDGRLKIGGRFLPAFTLATYVAPPVVALIPLFLLLRRVGLLNTLTGLVVVNGLANLPVAFWLLSGFIRRLPIEIDEAAWLDGAGHLTVVWRIIAPMMTPGLAATALICGILAFDEFLLASSFSNDPSTRTLPVAIALFQGERLVNFGQMAVASVTGIVPVYLIALLTQRWLVGGLTVGGIK